MKFDQCDSLWKRTYFSQLLFVSSHSATPALVFLQDVSRAFKHNSLVFFLSLRPWFPLLYFPKWGSVISKQKNAANHCHLGSSEVLPYGNSAFFKLACGVPAHSNGLRWKRISGREHSHDLGWRKGLQFFKILLIIFLLNKGALETFFALYKCRDFSVLFTSLNWAMILLTYFC